MYLFINKTSEEKGITLESSLESAVHKNHSKDNYSNLTQKSS